MRPRSLDEYFGQVGIVGPGQLLRRAIEADRLSSLILWGPPGTGKTSLAAVIARGTKSHFETINAVMAGVADIRKVVAGAQRVIANQDDPAGRRDPPLQPRAAGFAHVGAGDRSARRRNVFDVNATLLSRSRVFRPLGRRHRPALPALAGRARPDTTRAQ
jgi:putative ATPase